MKSTIASLLVLLVAAVPSASRAETKTTPDGVPVHPRVTVRSLTSPALGGESRRYVVYLPPGFDAAGTHRYPVVYLLHGLGGRGANWFRPDWGAIHAHLDALIASGLVRPLIAVAPDGGSGYWTNHLRRTDRRFGDFVAKDVVAAVDAAFPTDPQPHRRAVAGVSMGGHGAMSLVLRHRDVFGAAVSLGGALFPQPPTHRRVYAKVWGKPPNAAHWRKTSPIALLAGLAKDQPRLPALYLQCGVDDRLGFAPYARRAAEILKGKGVPHTLRMVPGGHTWATWGPEAAEWLPWVSGVLARAAPRR